MLSALQKFILQELFVSQPLAPSYFVKFYRKQKKSPKKADQQTIVIRSIERLIERGFCIAHGRRTKEKWFIDSVRLTPLGKHRARKSIQEKQLSIYST